MFVKHETVFDGFTAKRINRIVKQMQHTQATDYSTDEKKDVFVAVRCPQSLVEKLDAFITAFKAREPGVKLSRASAIRRLLHLGLEVR